MPVALCLFSDVCLGHLCVYWLMPPAGTCSHSFSRTYFRTLSPQRTKLITMKLAGLGTAAAVGGFLVGIVGGHPLRMCFEASGIVQAL